ncbi:MAG TPA: hypothetical protein DEB35_10530 [Desulfuromonas sp.]|nr:hypothetical protein [Desulfuromonas sp.]
MRRCFNPLVILATVMLGLVSPAVGSELVIIYGPKDFAVDKGKPVSVTQVFKAAAGEATLTVRNGNPTGDKRVSTGQIAINGVDVIAPADFNQQVATIERTVVLQDNNELVVQVGGKPESFITLTVAATTAAPPPDLPTATLLATPATIVSGEPATLAWTTMNAEQVTLEPGFGVVPFSGSIEVRPTQTILYRLIATGPGGQAVADTTITVTAPPAPQGITFDTYKGGALDGAAIDQPDLTVNGKIVVGNSAEVGVVVNGVVAQVDNGRFVANNVPLVAGLNTLTAAATDFTGQTWSTSAQVYCQPTSESVTLLADTQAGLAPLTVTLSVDGDLTRGVASAELLCDGPAQRTPVPAVEMNTYTVPLDVPGLYTCHFKVVDTFGTTYTDSVGILAYSTTALDALLKAKWTAMTAAMQQGNVTAAATLFSPRTRDAYSRQLTAMSSVLGQIVADMKGLTLVKIEGDKAIYDLRVEKAGVPYSFQLEFILDEDGLWRIRAF